MNAATVRKACDAAKDEMSRRTSIPLRMRVGFAVSMNAFAKVFEDAEREPQTRRMKSNPLDVGYTYHAVEHQENAWCVTLGCKPIDPQAPEQYICENAEKPTSREWKAGDKVKIDLHEHTHGFAEWHNGEVKKLRNRGAACEEWFTEDYCRVCPKCATLVEEPARCDWPGLGDEVSVDEYAGKFIITGIGDVHKRFTATGLSAAYLYSDIDRVITPATPQPGDAVQDRETGLLAIWKNGQAYFYPEGERAIRRTDPAQVRIVARART